MRIKRFAIILSIVFAVTALSGCGGDAPKENGDSGGDNAASGDKVKITLVHVEPEDRSVHKTAALFKEYVEEKSDGQIEVNILPNASFGGDRQGIEGVALGTVQMTVALSSVLTSYSNDYMILDLPFMFDNKKAAYNALTGELGDALNSVLPENGLVGLGFNDNGLRHVTNSKKPINEPNDLKGIKIRVVESPVYIDTFKLLGANPTPMGFNEVYTALQQGTVDAQENPAGLIYATKFFEVQKYMSLTGHIASFNIVVINRDFFEALPEDIQTIIRDGVKSCMVDQQWEMEAADDSMYMDKLREGGMQINEITPENLQKFKDTVAPIIDQYKGTKIRPELFEMVERANESAK